MSYSQHWNYIYDVFIKYKIPMHVASKPKKIKLQICEIPVLKSIINEPKAKSPKAIEMINTAVFNCSVFIVLKFIGTKIKLFLI